MDRNLLDIGCARVLLQTRPSLSLSLHDSNCIGRVDAGGSYIACCGDSPASWSSPPRRICADSSARLAREKLPDMMQH